MVPLHLQGQTKRSPASSISLDRQIRQVFSSGVGSGIFSGLDGLDDDEDGLLGMVSLESMFFVDSPVVPIESVFAVLDSLVDLVPLYTSSLAAEES